MKFSEKVLITGASGMLGSKMSAILAQKGFDILAVYNSNEEFIPNKKNIWKMKWNITREFGTNLKDMNTIIHCAAVTDINFCELNKNICHSVNIEGTKNLLNLAKRLDAKFIFISTPMVFSGKKGNYKEEDMTGPLNYYGLTKVKAERLVLKYKKGLVLRVNPIGKRSLSAHPSFMQWFVNMASSNRSFNLFTDVIINPINTGTLSDIVYQIIFNFRPGILHLGSKDKVNKAEIWNEVVKLFPNYSGRITKISVGKTHVGKIAPRPHKMWLGVNKASGLGLKMPSWKIEVVKTLKEILG